MGASWFERVRRFKSPVRVVSAFLLRSRETHARACQERKREVADLCQQVRAQTAAQTRLEQQNEELRQQVRRLEEEREERANRAWELPPDPPLGTHGFGARLISLAVNLAQRVGLRGARAVLRIVFEWLGVGSKVPCWTSIRNWLQRLGVAALKKPVARAEDWIWLADHSNQIGPEKVLAVLGVRASQLPAPGETLKHQDVRLLTVQPGISWKTADVAVVYSQLAEQYGTPRAVLVDGAPELRDGAEGLKERRSDTIVLRDFKHQAANLFQALIGQSERFLEFNKQVGQTRSSIQQTELAHLVPPAIRQKARFMNLQAVLRWAACLLWLLDHPDAKSRQLFTSQRLEEKLGWLRSFAPEIRLWNEYQQVISTGLTFLNQQGLFHGVAAQLRTALSSHITTDTARTLSERLITFVSDAESQLKPDERLWLSTEILESTFALYKQLERQHSKGGFTSLIAAFGGLLQTTTPELIREAFARVSVSDVKQWVHTNLVTTLNSKRIDTYNEFNPKRATL